MALLETLLYCNLNESESGDLSLLPNDVVVALKKRIRQGAEDQQQRWANALELVHKAYSVEGVVRPDPGMAKAWKQYEEMLQYAVQQLAKNRGMDGDWRMSSAMFHEQIQPKQLFTVLVDNESYHIEGDSMEEVSNRLSEEFVQDYDVKEVFENNTCYITVSKWGIKHLKIVIQ